MRQYRRSSHSVFELHYHFVFATKYRKPVLRGEVAMRVRELIREIKGYPVLEGYRGQEPVDVANLEEMILKVSNFAEQYPEVEELDLNPIFAYKDGAVAVDARVILKEG